MVTTRVALICHASTTAVRAADFADDEPLDPHGLRKLATLARPPVRADRALTSPALRARQTAEALGLDAEVDAALSDWDLGRWRGRSMAGVHADDPEGLEAWLQNPDAAPHGGETLRDVLGRTSAWLETLRRREGSVVAVTHAAIVRAAIVSALGAEPASFWRVDVAPLSVTSLTSSHGRWNLASIAPLAGARG
ncbi:histidine phosphatase family protein [Hansschlegelia plantiphila]|uniref:Phosphoglycerate mutase n=1 Tax=Hansschlegelia plantiphila TaxID=374655 RepID=A0A9W6J0Q7_9HYPH|nr:histidine phosphatase family protein [Hansschlegelia plantiphila]GLK67145.1 phosphoglycerate mutase [Hansschlegelia plantiphila]